MSASVLSQPAAEAPAGGASRTEEPLTSPPPPPASGDLLLQRDAVLETYKRPPMELVRGEGVHLFDAEGKRYLDFVSGIAVNALGYGDEGMHRRAQPLVAVSQRVDRDATHEIEIALGYGDE